MTSIHAQRDMVLAALLATTLCASPGAARAGHSAEPGVSRQTVSDSELPEQDAARNPAGRVSSSTWLQKIGTASRRISFLKTRQTTDHSRQNGNSLAGSRKPAAAGAGSGDDASGRIDGTWREEDGYVIINLNGQELRLARTGSTTSSRQSAQDATAEKPAVMPAVFSADSESAATSRSPQGVTGGSVLGHLLHRGRPVIECQVTLVPLRRSFGRYEVDDRAEPQTAVTALDGSYRFDHVPQGPYKLFWLPKGERQWIRRIEYRPDVRVRNGEVSRIKAIRTSLRTLN